MSQGNNGFGKRGQGHGQGHGHGGRSNGRYRGTSYDDGGDYGYIPPLGGAGDGGDGATEKSLPHNLDAEAGFLGSILIDPEVLPRCLWVDPKMFYREAHRHIFDAMIECLRSEREYGAGGEHGDVGSPGDLIQTCDMLERLGKLEEVGGVSYVASLANQVPTSQNWRYYAHIVENCWLCRKAIYAAGQIAAIAYNRPDGPVLREEAMKLLTAALLEGEQKHTRWMGDVLSDLYEQTEARMRGDLSMMLLRLGYPSLDELLGGVELGEVVVIGGRPSAGKSAIGRDIFLKMMDQLRTFAADFNVTQDMLPPDQREPAIPVGTGLYVTLEMSDVRQARRIVSSQGNINGRSIRQGFRWRNQYTGEETVDEENWDRFSQVIGEVHSRYATQIQFLDQSVTLDSLELELRRACLEDHCRVVLVDQLDLLDADDEFTNRNEQARIGAVSRKLKQLAEKYKVIILLLCQLNRAAEGVTPTLAHLRMSGRIEQDADTVLLLERPAVSNPEGSSDEHWKYLANIHIAKAREADRDVTIPLLWDGAITTFSEWPVDWPIPVPDEEEETTAGGKTSSKTSSKTSGKASGKASSSARPRHTYINGPNAVPPPAAPVTPLQPLQPVPSTGPSGPSLAGPNYWPAWPGTGSGANDDDDDDGDDGDDGKEDE